MSSVAHQRAGRRALRSARRHYENFPVASVLLPRRMRLPVALIYAFARRADDIADEGTRADRDRLQDLDDMRRRLDLAQRGQASGDELIDALAEAMTEHQLPWQALYDLLSAFSQDVTVSRYASFEELADYCRRSANPVGRLLLHLYDAADERNLQQSDAICTALQLLNFLQDFEPDFRLRGRIYIPMDEMQRFGVDESWLRQRRQGPALDALLAMQRQRAAALLEQGAPLGKALPGRLGLELRAIIAGGRRIARKLEQRTDPYVRPHLHAGDWVTVCWSALRP